MPAQPDRREALLRRRHALIATASVVAAVMLGLGFFLGQDAAYSGMGLDPGHYREMEAALPEMAARLEEKQAQIEVLEARRQVDRQALEMVRREIAEQKEQIAGLEEGLRFYRSLMAPEEIAQGLSLRELELKERGDRRYGFRIVAQQEARKHTTLRGKLYAEVRGVLDGERVSFPLAELSEDLEDNEIPLRFRYFQPVEGVLVLPAGFQPESVYVVATSTTPSTAEVSERYPWRPDGRYGAAGN